MLVVLWYVCVLGCHYVHQSRDWIVRSSMKWLEWDVESTLWFKKCRLLYSSNNSVDPKRTWTIFCRNTARGICSLLLCTFSYYLIMQLGTSLCCHGNKFEEAPSPGTHGGKIHRAWFVRKNIPSVSMLAVYAIFFIDEKNFHGSSTSQQSKW